MPQRPLLFEHNNVGQINTPKRTSIAILWKQRREGRRTSQLGDERCLRKFWMNGIVMMSKYSLVPIGILNSSTQKEASALYNTCWREHDLLIPLTTASGRGQRCSRLQGNLKISLLDLEANSFHFSLSILRNFHFRNEWNWFSFHFSKNFWKVHAKNE